MLHCNPLKGGAGDWFGDNKVRWWAGTVKSPLHTVWSSLYWSLILSTCADRRQCLLVCLDVAQQLVCSYLNSYWCNQTTRTQILYLHLKELQVWHMFGCGECRRSEYCSAATELLKYFLSGKGVVILLPTLLCQKRVKHWDVFLATGHWFESDTALIHAVKML